MNTNIVEAARILYENSGSLARPWLDKLETASAPSDFESAIFDIYAVSFPLWRILDKGRSTSPGSIEIVGVALADLLGRANSLMTCAIGGERTEELRESVEQVTKELEAICDRFLSELSRLKDRPQS